MSVAQTFVSGHSGGSVALADSVTVSGSVAAEVNVALAANTTNQLVALGYLTANIKGVYIKSDANVTIKVDSTGAPEETINIVAGVPYTWYTGRPDACLLSTDCNVGWYMTCVGAANFYARILN
jgi:hypothetical protein